MASALLAKLKVKPIPAKQESILVKINKPEPAVDELVDINVKIADKTKQKLINREEFLQRMKYVKETVTKIPESPKISKEEDIKDIQDIEDKEEPSIFIVKPKKIGKLVLFPCEDIGKLTFKSIMPARDESIKMKMTPKLKVVGEELGDKTAIIKQAKDKLGIFEGEVDDVKIGDKKLSEILPKKSEKILIKADSYYLNNRK